MNKTLKVGWRPQSLNRIKAGVRYRFLNPLWALQQQGVAVELYRPEQADQYAAVIYQAWSMFRSSEADADPRRILDEVARLKELGVRVIVDNCDNQFHNPKNLPEWNATLGHLRALLAQADELVVSTAVLAEVMRPYVSTSCPITVIGDAVETDADVFRGESFVRRRLNWRRWPAVREYLALRAAIRRDEKAGYVPLVWFGSQGNGFAEAGMLDLLRIREVVQARHRIQPLTLTIISNSRPKFDANIRNWSLPTHYLDWNLATFLPALRLHRIALLPIGTNPFTWCKSNNRLALALNEGLAVVADSIPAYREFEPFCPLDDWAGGLARYMDPAARETDVRRGRAYIAKHCTLSQISLQWRALIERQLFELNPNSQTIAQPEPTTSEERAVH